MFTFLVIEKVIYNERPFFSPIKFVDVFKMYNLRWWGFLIIEKDCKQSVYSTALICVDLVYISWSLKCCFWEILNNRNACAIILNVRSSEQKVRFHLVKIYIEDFDNIYYYHSTLISRKTGWKSIQELSLLFWNSSVSLKLFQNRKLNISLPFWVLPFSRVNVEEGITKAIGKLVIFFGFRNIILFINQSSKMNHSVLKYLLH